MNIFLDSHLGDDHRRAALYAGDLFVFSPHPAPLAMVGLAA